MVFLGYFEEVIGLCNSHLSDCATLKSKKCFVFYDYMLGARWLLIKSKLVLADSLIFKLWLFNVSVKSAKYQKPLRTDYLFICASSFLESHASYCLSCCSSGGRCSLAFRPSHLTTILSCCPLLTSTICYYKTSWSYRRRWDWPLVTRNCFRTLSCCYCLQSRYSASLDDCFASSA